MKRLNGLFEEVCSLDNLYLADAKARRNKLQSYGVKIHDQNKDSNLLQLREMLINQTFQTSEYDVFTLYEPKERLIFRLPYFPDRIVHHAIMNVLEPIWTSIFTTDTYSCIKDRGIHAAAKNVKYSLKTDPKGTQYCLKLDIRKFYPSVDHDILKSIIRRKIKDKKLLWLLDEIIDSADGVPIGNYLSQYFANLYLAYFDHWLKEEKGVKHYFRYADDMVILSDNKQGLHALLREMRVCLRDNLKLKIKHNYQVFPVNRRGIDFVGYRFFHSHTLLRKSIKKNFCRRVTKLNKRKSIKYMDYKRAVCSWWGWSKHCDSKNLLKTILKNAPYEIKFKR